MMTGLTLYPTYSMLVFSHCKSCHTFHSSMSQQFARGTIHQLSRLTFIPNMRQLLASLAMLHRYFLFLFYANQHVYFIYSSTHLHSDTARSRMVLLLLLFLNEELLFLEQKLVRSLTIGNLCNRESLSLLLVYI